MQYWIAALAVALLVVVGYAAGPLGAVITLLAFLIALFLLWARDLGFKGAWTRFGLNRISPPLWKRENWDQFEGIFVDRDKVVRAIAIALALIALSLMLPKNLVFLAFLAVAVWFVVEIYRANKPAASLTRTDGPRIN
jgi:hypothetical protein